MDANFRLKNRDRFVRNDVSLGDGWGHWVPSGPFMEHIATRNEDLEVRPRLLAYTFCRNLVTADKSMR